MFYINLYLCICLLNLSFVFSGYPFSMRNVQDTFFKETIEKIEREEYPNYVVKIQKNKGGNFEYVCDGVLISQKRVVTAASCVKDVAEYRIMFHNPKNEAYESLEFKSYAIHKDFYEDNNAGRKG
ncbi:hypothetical protein AYI68_g4283, partial [Smittium mucronatum]